MIRAKLNKIRFRDGKEISLCSSTILAVIGPNNSGKSTLLSDIVGIMTDEAYKPHVIDSIFIDRQTAAHEVKELLSSYLNPNGHYAYDNRWFPQASTDQWWNGSNGFVGPIIGQMLLLNLTTRTRLSDCDPPTNSDLRVTENLNHPFKKMFRDDQLEQRISLVFRNAFKMDLLVHRGAGGLVPLYVGDQPNLAQGQDRVSLSYFSHIESLPELLAQGDGIRSFVSIVSRILSEDHPIQIIDEPEAFLHPPQARSVAETIASHNKHQVVLATHSSDVLQGLLSQHSHRVRVVRLSRSKTVSTVAYLDSASIALLWRDPILRFSNILDGIFHDGVVVTEADGDCRFYQSMVNAVVKGEALHNIHYTYSGGKDRMSTVVTALIGLQVPVVSVVDFDILDDDVCLRKLTEAHGLVWCLIDNDWRMVKEAVERHEVFMSGDLFRQEMQKLLQQIEPGQAVPRPILKQVKSMVRNASPWDKVKDVGVNGMPKGEPSVAAKRILAELRKVGILVVPVGEMEGFCRSIDAHGPRWVESVMKYDLVNSPELEDARLFGQDIHDSITAQLAASVL